MESIDEDRLDIVRWLWTNARKPERIQRLFHLRYLLPTRQPYIGKFSFEKLSRKQENDLE